MVEIGRHERHALLIDAPDLAGARVDDDVGDRLEGYGPVALGIDDEAPDLVDRVTVVLLRSD